MKIRTAVASDAENLRELSIETFYKKWLSTNTEQDLQSYMNEHFSIERLKMELSDDSIIYFVSEVENKLVAYNRVNRNKSEGDLQNRRAIEIQRMYVLEEYNRKGIGKKLMEAAIELAVREKFEVMWLGVWENNTPAINFYKNFGFEFYGSHEFILGEDITTDLLMKKNL